MGDTMREEVVRAAFDDWFKKFYQCAPDIDGDPVDLHHLGRWNTWRYAFEQGRQLGMEQANALWQMAKDAEEKGLHEREPLTDSAINKLISAHEVYQYYPGALLEFVRDIEAAHGITPTQQASDSDKT